MSRPEHAIEIKDLKKTFTINHTGIGSLKTALLTRYRVGQLEKRQVLRGVNLTVDWGECVAIVGRNGAGKSTLLSLLSRVYKPTEGFVKINGRVAPLLELGAGFHPDLTALENVMINGVILGLTRKEVEQRLDAIVTFSELQKHLDVPIRTYSSGMLARLGFAVAINCSPEILIVDEVLGVGDFEFREKCEKAITTFKEGGGTILFVSHDGQTIRDVADRAAWLKDGLIIMEGTPDEVLEKYESDDAPTFAVDQS